MITIGRGSFLRQSSYAVPFVGAKTSVQSIPVILG